MFDKIFKQKEPTEAQIREKAQKLIKEQFEKLDQCLGSSVTFSSAPSPAARFAEELIRQEIEKKPIQDMINETIEEAVKEILDTKVSLVLSGEINHCIQQTLSDNLIEELVKRINNVQVKK